MNAIGPVGRAIDHLMKEDDLALPFAHLHRMAGQPLEIAAKVGEFMIMGGEQGPAPVHLVQMLEACPGDRQPVIGRGAAANLVEDDKGPVCRPVEDGGGLHHLDHKGRATAGQIIRGADPAEHAVDHADGAAFRRYEQAGLGHDGDMGVLPQKGRFASHIGAGDKPDIAAIAKLAVIRDEALTGRQHRLDHRVTPTDDLEADIIANLRTAEGPARRQRRRCQRDINGGDGLGCR